MDLDVYLRFVLALAGVLALIGGLAWAARRSGFGAGGRVRGGAQRRLALVEILPVDAKRRLLLVRRDGVEHLILTGPAADLVVETGIAPASPPAQPSAAA